MDIEVQKHYADKFSHLKYGQFLAQFFAIMLQEDVSIEDVDDFIKFIEDKLGITVDELNKQIDIGVKNGYEPEDQITIICAVLREDCGVSSEPLVVVNSTEAVPAEENKSETIE